MSLNTSILALFEQLGLLDAVMGISKLHTEVNLFDTGRSSLGTMGAQGCKEAAGNNSIAFARPDFYCILLSKIPSEKIKLNKQVVHIENGQSEVVIRCSDDSIYRGDILVGADGAYSSVRQRLYQQLSSEQKLPLSDSDQMVNGYICIVGVTDAQRQDKYPELRDARSHFRQTIDNDNSSWHVATLPGNRIGWGISSHFTFATNDQRFQNTEWNPESNEAILKRYRDSPSNFGNTMGDIIDATPKTVISTVYLEEKLYETWHYERTVLIGDGAIHAMQDAVILSNCIDSMSGNTRLENIQAAFRSYKDQRYPRAKTDIANSMFISRIMTSQQWSDRLMRKLVFQYLPTWATTSKTAPYRPQAVFLPLIGGRGSESFQKSSKNHEQQNAVAI
ncbi:hypothetical protein BGX26_000111 [Mortierella sp. AD094]|nr:hypothetical protein BGX26_000111 [Mortierella sp. AD094]